jgi:hypothetical protein
MPISLAIKVSNQICLQSSREHVEAVIDEAIQIWRSHQDWEGTLVVLTPERIAVILEKGVNRGVVVPIDSVYPALGDATRRTVQAWLDSPWSRRQVVLIKGNWFGANRVEASRTTFVGAGFISTNMPYDSGPRLGE